MNRPLVLVGSGRPHLLVLESMAAGRLHLPGTVLVSPSPTEALSDMVPGLIAGRYVREELEFDLAALASAAGAEFVPGSVQRVDPVERTILLQSGQCLPFQVAGFAIGGDPPGGDQVGIRAHALFLKPVHRAAAIPPTLERAAREMGPEPVRAVIVGGGPTGVSAALGVRNRLDRLGATRAVVTLVETGHQLMGGHASAAIREAHRALRRAEVTLRLGMTAVEAGAGHVRLANGAVLPADALIWATGTGVTTLFRESGMSVDGEGRLLVEDTLRAVGTPGVFATGHSVVLRSNSARPGVRMDAARAGSVLAHNLRAALSGDAEPSHRFRPPPRSLRLIDTGDGSAILSYGQVAFTSRWARWLKDRFDRQFVARFRTLASPSSPRARAE